jgi:hypothetical protein
VRLKVRTNSGVKVPVGQKHWLSVAEGNCVGVEGSRKRTSSP